MSYKRICYIAYPVSGDVERNLELARLWIAWALSWYPDVVPIAPWIVDCEVCDDDDRDHRALGLERDLFVIGRCDEVWLVGPRVSVGMEREAKYALARGKPVWDYTSSHWTGGPPDGLPGVLRWMP